jgi:hypothetical protein
MVIRLVIDFGEFIKMVLKRGEWEKGSWVGDEFWCLLGFVSLVCGWVYFLCCSGGCCVRDCRGLGFCIVGTVGCSVGDDCVRGRGSMVTGWGRMVGGGEDGEKSE